MQVSGNLLRWGCVTIETLSIILIIAALLAGLVIGFIVGIPTGISRRTKTAEAMFGSAE